MATRPRVEISPDKGTLAERFAEWLVDRYEDTSGSFVLNLSGGSTPKSVYALLATELYRRKFDWERIHVFFGDERFVPPDHPDSNYRMASEAMLSKVPIPAENVHAVPTAEGNPASAAAAYQQTVQRFYGKDTLDLARPVFTVTLLGLGEDGHTASLFPGTGALTERQAWVTSVVGAKPEPRITMTYPLLASSGSVAFLVSGTGKQAMLQRLLDGDQTIPSGRITSTGEIFVFCDEAALGKTL